MRRKIPKKYAGVGVSSDPISGARAIRPANPVGNRAYGILAQRMRIGGQFGPENADAPAQAKASFEAGMETLPGSDTSDIPVHSNSGKAAQLGGRFFAQGRDIRLGSGQENFFPPEAWHVGQQAQGRATPTVQAAGAGRNGESRQAPNRIGSTAQPYQLKRFESTVVKPSEAMDASGGDAGERYRSLGLGLRLLVDDADIWEPASGGRWYRVLRIGPTDLSTSKIYVRDNAVEADSETPPEQFGDAMALQETYGAVVDKKVAEICAGLGIERRPVEKIDRVEHVIRYFAWLEKIGEKLGEIFPELNEFVQGQIPKALTGEQLNENTPAGMELDRALIEAINKHLKVLTTMLAEEGTEVVESLIDASGGGTLRKAIAGVRSGKIDLKQTLRDYLTLGMRGIAKAMGHKEARWNDALTDALRTASGCYAWQAQAIDRLQPAAATTSTAAPVFDPNYETWKLTPSELTMMIDNVNGNETDAPKVKVGDKVSSPYVNVGFVYAVTSVTDKEITLKAIR